MPRDTAAVYVRLSKEDIAGEESESESIRNQKEMLTDYAAGKKWQIYSVYCDEDYSGAYSGEDNIRPGFNRMIRDASEGRFNIVLCKSQSRFSRNMEVIERYIHGRFPEWGIRFVSLVDNADTDIKGNKKSRQINSLINEWYLEDLSENVRAVFRHKMERGEFLAAFPPYGYSKDKNNKNHLVINPDTAPVVRQIFEWHAGGYGAARISRMLNERGIPNPRKQQERDGLRKTYMYGSDETGLWTASTVSDILHNKAYCGDVENHRAQKVSYKSKKIVKIAPEDRIIARDMHEPIISRGMFEDTQNRLSERRKASGTGKVHILSGKVFCYWCKKPMQKNNGRGGYEYLRCRDKYAYPASDRCPTPNIRIDTVLSSLQMRLISEVKNSVLRSADEKTLKSFTGKVLDKDTLTETELKKLREEKVKIENKQYNLYQDRLNDIISVEQYVSFNKGFTKRLEEINSRIEKIREADPEENGAEKDKQDLINEAISLLGDAADREIIDELIDRIEFGERDEGSGSHILRVIWAW